MSGRRLTPLVAAGLAVAPVAMASEPAHHQGAGIPIGPLVFSAINLLIFIGILARFVLPAVRDWVRDRRASVVKALEDAARAKAEALSLRTQWEARLAAIDQTIAEMRAQSRLDAERERDRILATAQKTAESIRKDAERAAAYEVRRTQQLLRAELVKQAVRLAEDAARTTWSPTDQQRFVGDFLKQVQQ